MQNLQVITPADLLTYILVYIGRSRFSYTSVRRSSEAEVLCQTSRDLWHENTAAFCPKASSETLAGVNHLFQRAVTGSRLEYETLGQAPDKSALERIAGWMAAL